MAVILALLALLSQTPTGATLEGGVIRSETLEPMNGAHILVTKVEGHLADSITAETGKDGKFRISNIPPGIYRVFVTRVGYVRSEYGQHRINGTGSPIRLTAGQVMNNMVLTLSPTAVITGRVFGEHGEPLSRVYVRALKASYSNGERELISGPEAETNDLGEYRLYNLRPGFYFISATPYTPSHIDGDQYVTPTPPCPDCRGEGTASRALGMILRGGGFIDPLALSHQTFIPQYYPGTTDPAEAKPLDVRPGTVVSGINLGISRVSGVLVSGSVIDGTTGDPYDASGDPICTAAPQLRRFSAFGRNAGVFQLTGVQPGRLVIRCMTGNLGGTLTVDVGESDIGNIHIVLHPLIHLEGHIRFEGTATPNALQLTKMRVLLDPTEQGVAVRPDGSFTTSGVISGEHRLMVTGLPSEAYLKTVRFARMDVFNNVLQIDADQQSMLELLISFRPGRLIGSVTDDNGRPTAGATVAIIPRQQNRPDLYRSAITDGDGHFLFSGLPPGEYSLIAWEDIEEDAWRDTDIFHLYESRAQLVQVREDKTENVAVKVSK